jgi:hypothetical protein
MLFSTTDHPIDVTSSPSLSLHYINPSLTQLYYLHIGKSYNSRPTSLRLFLIIAGALIGVIALSILAFYLYRQHKIRKAQDLYASGETGPQEYYTSSNNNHYIHEGFVPVYENRQGVGEKEGEYGMRGVGGGGENGGIGGENGGIGGEEKKEYLGITAKKVEKTRRRSYQNSSGGGSPPVPPLP